MKGKINAPPVVGPNPGNTPNIKPNNVPNSKTNKNVCIVDPPNYIKAIRLINKVILVFNERPKLSLIDMLTILANLSFG